MQVQKGSCIWTEGVVETLRVFGPPPILPKKDETVKGKGPTRKGRERISDLLRHLSQRSGICCHMLRCEN